MLVSVDAVPGASVVVVVVVVAALVLSCRCLL